MMFVIIFLYCNIYKKIHLFVLCLTVHFLDAGMQVIVCRSHDYLPEAEIFLIELLINSDDIIRPSNESDVLLTSCF